MSPRSFLGHSWYVSWFPGCFVQLPVCLEDVPEEVFRTFLGCPRDKLATRQNLQGTMTQRPNTVTSTSKGPPEKVPFGPSCDVLRTLPLFAGLVLLAH
jgi:hypothetical protein